ncbi:hypothetical protein QBC45DRAFT_437813 [Copromyces sp. CBS 386.78]|nr:hypothetical protein QBC45DRAFT_437813 [Copromyces sp. CBS 386.78]
MTPATAASRERKRFRALLLRRFILYKVAVCNLKQAIVALIRNNPGDLRKGPGVGPRGLWSRASNSSVLGSPCSLLPLHITHHLPAEIEKIVRKANASVSLRNSHGAGMVPISDHDAGRHITIFRLQRHAMSRPDGHSAALHASPPHQPTGLSHNHSIITPNTNTIALLTPGERFTFGYTANPAAGSNQTSFFSDGRDSNASMVTSKDHLGIPIGVGEIDQIFFDEAQKAVAGPNDGFGLDWEDTPTGDIGRSDHLPIGDLWNDAARKRRKGDFGIGFKSPAAPTAAMEKEMVSLQQDLALGTVRTLPFTGFAAKTHLMAASTLASTRRQASAPMATRMPS